MAFAKLFLKHLKKVSKSNIEFMLPYGEFYTQASVGACFMRSYICIKDDLVHVCITAGPLDCPGDQILVLTCSLFPTTWNMGIAQSRKQQ